MKRFPLKRLLALFLAVVMVMGLGMSGVSAATTGTNSLSFEKLDAGEVSVQLASTENAMEDTTTPLYDDDEQVRVMIILDEPAAISMVEDDEEVASSETVARYQTFLKVRQQEMAAAISDDALDGEELDVVSTLTLVANAISANVAYGSIDAIRQIDGIRAVYMETRYLPMSTADTSNIVAQTMTGADSVQQSGYTGAGSRIAVIDTGTDTDHQSFSAGGYEYALAENAENAGMSYDEYVASLNLLTVEEIADVLPQLHVSERYEGITAEDLYYNAKQPFNYNYIDNNLDVTHDNDDQGEHGSHVAGISTANRYIPVGNLYDFDGDGDFDRADAQAVMNYVVKGTEIENAENADLSGDGEITTDDVHLILDALEDQENGGAYVSAADTVGVTGVAPDAQLITMKVFGADGGAYASDYMAAVEDAILLGCDAVNLSLGAPYAGYVSAHEDTDAESDFIDEAMDAVAKAGIVMCVAAGNSGNWADNDEAFGLMYADEAGTANISEPATYTETLAVASADNVGSVSDFETTVTVGSSGTTITPEDAGSGVNEAWRTLGSASGTTYEAVFLGDPTNLLSGEEQTDMDIYGGYAVDYSKYDLTGKIVFVARGNGVYFSDKHAAAAEAGAAAVIVYNNASGTISLSVSGSEATIPCASITLAQAQEIFNMGGLSGCTVTVTHGLSVDYGEDVEYPTMSSFSSWGTTGALTIKPEITAPGGSIYSVNGGTSETDAYELMSGTSMATPHVSGLVALAAQYIRENDLTSSAAAQAVGISARDLAQSLLMSTATPLIEEDSGVEYSVRNQGAGLGNIENVTEAQSFVLVDGQTSGKVKAELGDGTEPWSFTFSLNNLTDSAVTYDLSASILTTDVYHYYDWDLALDQMTKLESTVTFSTGDTVTVPASGSAEVTVTIAISEETAAAMAKEGFTNGFYVEGYIYAEPQATAEGVVGATHSIPLLAWYGNWTDPSMFDAGSYLDYVYDTQDRYSHVDSSTKNVMAWTIPGYEYPMYYTGNIYGYYAEGVGSVGDSSYIADRNAINTTDDANWEFYAIFPTLIRNATDFKIEVSNSDTGEVYYCNEYENLGYDDTMLGCFYYSSYGVMYDTTTEYGISLGDWDYTDAAGNALAEGTDLTFTLYVAPDYYMNGTTVRDWSELGKGATLSFDHFTVDNTAPKLLSASLEDGLITVEVQDNNYVAAVVLVNGAATESVDYIYPDMTTDEKGAAVTGTFEVTVDQFVAAYGRKAVIAVCDYAGNETYYAVNLGGEGTSYGDLVGFQYDPDGSSNIWVSFGEGVSSNESQLFVADEAFVSAEYVNGYIFAETEDGKLYGIRYEDMLANKIDLDEAYITRLENVYQDMAYDYSTGTLYGLCTTDEGYPKAEIYSINISGSYFDYDNWMQVDAYQEDWVTSRGNVYGLALACDDEGNVYLLATTTDDDGNDTTAQLWKAEMEEVWGYVSLGAFKLVGDTGVQMNYLQSMTWDHNSETLYWAQFYPTSMFSVYGTLQIVDPETAECTQVGKLTSETCALFAPLTDEDAIASHANVPTFDDSVVATPILSQSNLTMSKGSKVTLTCTFDPWYSKYTDVTWSSNDTGVATVKNGVVTAVADGTCTITVTSTEDSSKYDTCTVTVASLNLDLEGIISYTSGGVNSVSDSTLYSFTMRDGESELTLGKAISAEDDLNYGLNIASATEAKGSIWACEFGNTGMIYEIDKQTGEVLQAIEPVDAGTMYGLAYSEATGSFTGIMNYYLYVDQPLSTDAYDDIQNSYDEATNDFYWHRINLAEYLDASDNNFNTGESEEGSIVDVVLSGVTMIDNDGSYSYENTYKDYLGSWDYNNVYYTPDTTIVLLDNVGRLWYIDEITGLTAENNGYSVTYMDDNGDTSISSRRNGVIAIDNEDGTYNVFVIRDLVETTLTDMYWEGTLPGYTYHFSSIYYAGQNEDGRDMFLLSLYDYWNNSDTNQLYLLIPGEEDEVLNTSTWDYDIVSIPDELYDLGTTGNGYIIATITNATIYASSTTENTEQTIETTGVVNGLYRGFYAAR